MEASFNYNRTFGDHTVTALVLYNQQKEYYPKLYSDIPHGYVGLVGRVTYDWKSRYMAEFNVGYNGSENFASDLRFSYFPAGSISEQAAMIEETEFIPIDRETTIAPMAVQALPQKERRQVITETEKTVTKAEKEKETKAKRGKKPKEKAARRDKTAGNTVLALKNNLLYDLALAPNIEIEIPVGKRWSVNLEYKSPWWSNSSKEICYQLISGGIESRYWLGNRELHHRLNGHFFGLYAEGGIYDFQFKGDGYQGKYYGAAGFTYGYSTSVSRHLALEFSLGIGYLTTEYQKYTPYEGSLVWMSSGNYTFIGPTKAKISLVWVITKKRGRK